MACIRCYKLIIGGVESIYSIEQRTDGNAWFRGADRVTSGVTIAALEGLTDTVAKRLATETACAQIVKPLVSFPYGTDYVAHGAVVTLPVGAKTVTVMVEPSSDNPVEVSFDAGVSWGIPISQGEVKTWDSTSGTLVLTDFRLRGLGGSATFDIHGEKA